MIIIDPINKLFKVTIGTVKVDVWTDLYSLWKDWVHQDINNLKYQPAFRTTGGDKISQDGSQLSPRFFFLINNWQVEVQNSRVEFNTNLYSDDPAGPFILDNASVLNNSSNVPVVLLNNLGGTNQEILDSLLIDHVQSGTFGELLQKTFLAAAKE